MSKSNKQSKRNGKGRSSGSKPNSRPLAPDVHVSQHNDWRWYAQNEQLLKDTASFAFGYPIGSEIDLGQYGMAINEVSVPGIMTIHTNFSYGYSDHFNSPINVAARNVFSFVRAGNSGSTNYDTPDLMIYLAALDSIFAYHAWLKRLYGLAQTYNVQNRYYPVAMIQAQGVDYADLAKNLADFRAYINMFAVRAGSMCIPANMSFMAKHMWMYSGVYLDTPNNKAQTYMFTPDAFFQFAIDDETSAGCLIQRKLRNYNYESPDLALLNMTLPAEEGWVTDSEGTGLKGLLMMEDLRRFGDALLDPVVASQDFNIMSGDILKAYGPEGIYRVEGISEIYTVIPMYDPEVMDQIENATLISIPRFEERSVNGGVSAATVLFQQRSSTFPNLPNGMLVHTPGFVHPFSSPNATQLDAGANAWLIDRTVNFMTDAPTPANVMEATRMTNIATSYDHAEDEFTILTLGSEYAMYAKVWYYAHHLEISTQEPYGWSLHYSTFYVSHLIRSYWNSVDPMTKAYIVGYVTDAQRDFRTVQFVTLFDRHPQVALVAAAYDVGVTPNEITTASISGYFQELANYTIVDEEDLKQLSEVALLSEFDVRQYGKQTV